MVRCVPNTRFGAHQNIYERVLMEHVEYLDSEQVIYELILTVDRYHNPILDEDIRAVIATMERLDIKFYRSLGKIT